MASHLQMAPAALVSGQHSPTTLPSDSTAFLHWHETHQVWSTWLWQSRVFQQRTATAQLMCSWTKCCSNMCIVALLVDQKNTSGTPSRFAKSMCCLTLPNHASSPSNISPDLLSCTTLQLSTYWLPWEESVWAPNGTLSSSWHQRHQRSHPPRLVHVYGLPKTHLGCETGLKPFQKYIHN